MSVRCLTVAALLLCVNVSLSYAQELLPADAGPTPAYVPPPTTTTTAYVPPAYVPPPTTTTTAYVPPAYVPPPTTTTTAYVPPAYVPPPTTTPVLSPTVFAEVVGGGTTVDFPPISPDDLWEDFLRQIMEQEPGVADPVSSSGGTGDPIVPGASALNIILAGVAIVINGTILGYELADISTQTSCIEDFNREAQTIMNNFYKNVSQLNAAGCAALSANGGIPLLVGATRLALIALGERLNAEYGTTNCFNRPAVEAYTFSLLTIRYIEACSAIGFPVGAACMQSALCKTGYCTAGKCAPCPVVPGGITITHPDGSVEQPFLPSPICATPILGCSAPGDCQSGRVCSKLPGALTGTCVVSF